MEDGEYTLLDYVSSVAAFSSILYYATGWPLVWRVTKRRDTGIISTFPYVALLTNCTVWTLYGKLADNFVLKLVNFVGASHQIVYILVLYYYSKSKRLFNMQLLYSVMFIAGIFSYSYLT
ncbi:SLC50A1 [Bugula neritina]|uniref:Sugar transporter SWEET1 n=1 Tax=Bugula neritina TaxID=10212 RepID=A0A7J7K9H4_BUGNE|nr:SLC50A1 [Bugula neritina]